MLAGMVQFLLRFASLWCFFVGVVGTLGSPFAWQAGLVAGFSFALSVLLMLLAVVMEWRDEWRVAVHLMRKERLAEPGPDAKTSPQPEMPKSEWDDI